MIRAFLFDANGHDQEVQLDEQCITEFNERSLLWLDVQGRERGEMERIVGLFSLDRGSLRELLNPQEALYLDNYGEYFQFNVIRLADANERTGERALTKQRSEHLEFLVGPRWIVTVHEGELPFMQAFRPPALAASLLDWHLTTYFEAVTELEALLDRLDEALLSGSGPRNLLAGVVATRRRVSELRHLLAVQRPVFYGLSRPDLAKSPRPMRRHTSAL